MARSAAFRMALQEREDMQNTQTIRGGDIPAPVGGWNAKDPLADMPREDAVLFDNWIPRPGYVEIRRGSIASVTGFAASVQTLLVWRGGTADTDKMFAAAGTAIYDANTSGAVGAPLVTGLSTSRWQYTNFANDAGNFLLAFSGGDTPLKYDGSSWSTTTITGSMGSITLDPTQLSDCCINKRRVFMVEEETLRVWFLAVEAIAGDAGLLDLGPVFDKGGVLVGIGTWTIDGGQGADDMAVFITNQGQVAIYQGIDPSDANNWALIGVYEIGRPLGRRALLKYGAELIVLTADGAIPLSQALKLDRAEQKNIAITAKIQNAFAVASRSYASNLGWEGILYPAGQLAIFNVPVTSLGLSQQYVQNVQTGAWCRFTGLNAFCWGYANSQIFFGGATAVYRWDTGGSDNGTAITCDLTTAFSGFNTPHRLKNFTMLRPIMRAPRSVLIWVDVLVDYQSALPSNIPAGGTTDVSSGVWGSGLWGQAVWTSSQPLRLAWTSATGIGYVGAARLRFVSNPQVVSGVYPEVKVQLIGFDVMYQPGGML